MDERLQPVGQLLGRSRLLEGPLEDQDADELLARGQARQFPQGAQLDPADRAGRLPQGSKQSLGAEAAAIVVFAVARPAARLDQPELIARPSPHHPFRPLDHRQVVLLESSPFPAPFPLRQAAPQDAACPLRRQVRAVVSLAYQRRERVVCQPHHRGLALTAPAEVRQQVQIVAPLQQRRQVRADVSIRLGELARAALRRRAEPRGVV